MQIISELLKKYSEFYETRKSHDKVRHGQLMKFNSCFNFKLSKCVGVFSQYKCGVIECNEWKTQKGHECTNMEMEKVKRLQL
jgi:hypothetical protein